MRKLVYVLPFLGAILGGMQLLSSLIATSAPQQAAGAAMAAALAVIPYVFARALAEMIDNPSPRLPVSQAGPFIPTPPGAAANTWSTRTKVLVALAALLVFATFLVAALQTTPGASRSKQLEKASEQDAIDQMQRERRR